MSLIQKALLGLAGLSFVLLAWASIKPEKFKAAISNPLKSKLAMIDVIASPQHQAEEKVKALAIECNNQVKQVRNEILNPFFKSAPTDVNHVSATLLIDRLTSDRKPLTKSCRLIQKTIEKLDARMQDSLADEKFVSDLNLYLFEQMISEASIKQSELYWRDFSDRMSDVEKIYFKDKVMDQHQKEIEILFDRERSLQSNLKNCGKFKNNKSINDQMEKFSRTTESIQDGFEAIKYTVELNLKSTLHASRSTKLPTRSVASVTGN